jgi:hypothetical protein
MEWQTLGEDGVVAKGSAGGSAGGGGGSAPSRQKKRMLVDELEIQVSMAAERLMDFESEAAGTLAVQAMWQDALIRGGHHGGFLTLCAFVFTVSLRGFPLCTAAHKEVTWVNTVRRIILILKAFIHLRRQSHRPMVSYHGLVQA